ncbi:S-layer homology domain-containing protein [Capilliphycus salinus ALCB114379]|uniref:S-layer homology domain-containing protein n=1 Tax=Capilliphycus salinus TaxID=2768948 RepID=UPI0039A46F4D
MNRKKGDDKLRLGVAVGITFLCQVEVSFAQSEIIPEDSTQPETVTEFSDIQGHWARGCIQTLAQREIVGGNREDDRFRPDEPMKRVELAIILTQAFPNVEPVRKPTTFADIPTTYWAYDAIREADRKGFLSGYIAGAFNPLTTVSRAQVLTALTQGLAYEPQILSTEQLDLIFTDANQIPETAQTAIAAATENGLVVNYPDVKRLNPNQPATRAEVATFICQAIADSRQTPFIPTQYIARIPAEGLSTPTPQTVVLNAKQAEEKPEIVPSATANTEATPPTPEPSEPSPNFTQEIPETPSETAANNAESLPEIPEIPETLEATASAQDVEALLFYQPENEASNNRKLRLQIVRRGILKFSEAILLVAGRNNQPTDEFLGVEVEDIDGDKEPEIILDFKINSSNAPVYYSLIYRYSPIRREYVLLRQDWGINPPERLQPEENVDV